MVMMMVVLVVMILIELSLSDWRQTAIVSMARVVLLSLLYPTGFQAKIQNSIKSLPLINTQGLNSPQNM